MAEQERWTPKVGQSYYYVSFFHEVPTASIGLREEDPFDDLKIKQLNCYQTYVEAQTAAEDMRKVLLRHAGGLHDLQWAISEMKKGNALTLPLRSEVFTYTPNKGFVVSYKGDKPIDGHYFDARFELEEILSTDWEIYDEE